MLPRIEFHRSPFTIEPRSGRSQVATAVLCVSMFCVHQWDHYMVNSNGALVQEDPDPERTARIPIVLGGAQCEGNETALSLCPEFEFGRILRKCRHQADVFLACLNEQDGGEHLLFSPVTRQGPLRQQSC